MIGRKYESRAEPDLQYDEHDDPSLALRHGRSLGDYILSVVAAISNDSA